jgi:V/A-type H+-transporting ATPase subunit A
MVYLQQDAFDEVDASTTQDRQKDTFELVRHVIQRDYPFKDKEEARRFFIELTRLMKNLNYASQGSTEYAAYVTQIDGLVKTLGRTATPTTKSTT